VSTIIEFATNINVRMSHYSLDVYNLHQPLEKKSKWWERKEGMGSSNGYYLPDGYQRFIG
jgi:hypothetical protein